jgi:hypothetical protein
LRVLETLLSAVRGRGRWSDQILRTYPQGFAQLLTVGQIKGRPFYGQAKGQLCPTWQSYAGLPPEEGA